MYIVQLELLGLHCTLGQSVILVAKYLPVSLAYKNQRKLLTPKVKWVKTI